MGVCVCWFCLLLNLASIPFFLKAITFFVGFRVLVWHSLVTFIRINCHDTAHFHFLSNARDFGVCLPDLSLQSLPLWGKFH